MLTEAELDQVSFPGVPVEAQALSWTKAAVKISFFEPGIKIQRESWVWIGSVTPAAPDEL
ncbi:hypothetical protein GCM10009582_25100 [Arthrobacter flavus]